MMGKFDVNLKLYEVHPETQIRYHRNMKLMKVFRLLYILFIFFIIGFTAELRADEYEDVIYLKDDSVVRGMIIEQIPGKSIKIKTKDDKELTFDIVEIKKIVKEKVKPPVSESTDSEPHDIQSKPNPVSKRIDYTDFSKYKKPISVGRAVCYSILWPGMGKYYTQRWISAVVFNLLTPTTITIGSFLIANSWWFDSYHAQYSRDKFIFIPGIIFVISGGVSYIIDIITSGIFASRLLRAHQKKSKSISSNNSRFSFNFNRNRFNLSYRINF